MRGLRSGAWVLGLALGLGVSGACEGAADEVGGWLEDGVGQLVGERYRAGFVGRTRAGRGVPCVVAKGDEDAEDGRFRVLLVGGLGGGEAGVRAVLGALGGEAVEGVLVSGVPAAGLGEIVGGWAFPPRGEADHGANNGGAHVLWRWVGVQAPDLVIEVREGEVGAAWELGEGSPAWVGELTGGAVTGRGAGAGGLVEALGSEAAAGMGLVPGARLVVADGVEGAAELSRVLARVGETERGNGLERSAARQELLRREGRGALEVARELAAVYGRRLGEVNYITALAVVGRLRLGELEGDEGVLAEVEEMVSDFLEGKKETMGGRAGGSQLSGHLLFTELARRTGDGRYGELARSAVDLGFEADGGLKGSMPFHNEMSDSVFMGCAPVAEVAGLTGEARYAEMALRHLCFMEGLCLREDGLYRHSPLDEAAWGRGNGFPALGLALALSALEEGSEEWEGILGSHLAHLEALRAHQDAGGMWHQVIDRPESYREFTVTCMIGFAVVRGLRCGWLDGEEWEGVAARAWRGVKGRIGEGGRVLDASTSTGKMGSEQEYFDRTALLGVDERSGAMALLFALEVLSL
jgi:unsaturated rhamnogalacturonyl hydrolase